MSPEYKRPRLDGGRSHCFPSPVVHCSFTESTARRRQVSRFAQPHPRFTMALVPLFLSIWSFLLGGLAVAAGIVKAIDAADDSRGYSLFIVGVVAACAHGRGAPFAFSFHSLSLTESWA